MRNAPWSTGKKIKGSYDPQVGEAAKANAAIAERSMEFSEKYFTDYVAPMLKSYQDTMERSQANEDQLFNSNMEDMQLARSRYKQFGMPAEDRYYGMVDEYSSSDEAEKQARLGLGDVRAAQAGQKQQMLRTMGSMGVDPTSPAAIAAMGDMAVMGAAAEAGASTRARDAAKALGMQLKADAANFGRGGQSAVLNFGGAASGNNQAGFGYGANGVGVMNSGAAVPQAGFGLGLKGYGANLDAYTSLNNTSMQARAQASGGFGQFLGTVAGLALPGMGGK